jgi:hypothetical protein
MLIFENYIFEIIYTPLIHLALIDHFLVIKRIYFTFDQMIIIINLKRNYKYLYDSIRG